MYSRKDMLHYKILHTLFGRRIKLKSIHYIPSIEQFTQMISLGYAYGMVPDWQSYSLRANGDVVEVHENAVDFVKLFWHCWNIDSAPLRTFSANLVKNAKTLLSRPDR